MKKRTILAALFVAAVSIHPSGAQVNLNKLKDKGQGAVDKAKENKKDKKDNEASSSSSSASASKFDSGLSGADLAEKGDALYDAGNYSEALAHYEEAEKRGYQDGEMRMKMNKCRDAADPAKQEEEKKAMADVDQKMNAMEKMKYHLEPVEDGGMSSATHGKYKNQIVFSKSHIDKGAENEGSFTNNFTLADHIYSRIYLDKSLTNQGHAIGVPSYNQQFWYRYTVEGFKHNDLIGNQININAYWEGDMRDKWTTFQVAMSPEEKWVKDYPSTELMTFWEQMYYLPEGSYKVKLEVIFDVPEDKVDEKNSLNSYMYTTKFGAERVVATGTYTINVKNSDKLAFSKRVGKNLPAPAKTDAALEASMIKAVTGQWDGQTPVKAAISAADWVYQRDVWGNITHRTITANVVLKFEKENVYKVFHMSFGQQNQGGDKYGITYYNGEASFDQFLIAKELIGK